MKWFREDTPRPQSSPPSVEPAARSGVTKAQRRKQAGIREAADAAETWETRDRLRWRWR
ncbi:hypothetical protein ACFY0G_17490 [Streptomyces sp. NPDC001552]|uniref:hypothetical protein n=1 Tax=Streptomyces sp. NPDC001552 TaxID=3364587 RepID=UPI00368E7494